MSAGRFDPPTGQEATTLDRLSMVIDAFRLVDPKMPSSYISAFLAVARKPGFGPSEYAKMIGTIQPIMSRVLLEIGPRSREGGAGYGLVDRVVHEESLRNQRYFLTPKGKQMIQQITKHLGGPS